MNEDRQEEFAALYAFDLLEGAERTEFEAALAGDPLLRQRVQELREAASALAHAAPAVEPPADLKRRILDSAAGSAGRRPPAIADVPGSSRRSAPRKVISFPALIPWAAAACFALAAAWAGQLYLTARSDAALLRDQQELANVELQSARTQLEQERILNERQTADRRQLLLARSKGEEEAKLKAAALADSNRQITDLTGKLEQERILNQRQTVESRQLLVARTQLEDEAKLSQKALADSGQQIAELTGKLKAQGDLAQLKIATLASMLGNSPQALAVAVWNPTSQEGVLTVSQLPAAAKDKDYQLWVIDPQYASPVSAGVISLDATGQTRVSFKADKSVKSVAKFAISLERKGGAPTPQGNIVLISQ